MQCVTAVLCYLEYPANAMVTSEIEYWVTEEVFVLTHARNIRFLSGVPPFWEFRFEFHFSIKFHHLTLYSTSHFPSRELKMAHELEEGDFTVEVIKPQISIESEKNVSLRGGPNWPWVIFTAVQTTCLSSEEILRWSKQPRRMVRGEWSSLSSRWICQSD